MRAGWRSFEGSITPGAGASLFAPVPSCVSPGAAGRRSLHACPRACPHACPHAPAVRPLPAAPPAVAVAGGFARGTCRAPVASPPLRAAGLGACPRTGRFSSAGAGGGGGRGVSSGALRPPSPLGAFWPAAPGRAPGGVPAGTLPRSPRVTSLGRWLLVEPDLKWPCSSDTPHIGQQALVESMELAPPPSPTTSPMVCSLRCAARAGAVSHIVTNIFFPNNPIGYYVK